MTVPVYCDRRQTMGNPVNKRGISNHFRREAKIMAGLFIFIAALGLFAAWLLPVIEHYLIVDRCLDSGGAVNYKTHNCEHAKPLAQK